MKSKKALFIIIPICLALVAAIVLLVFFLTGAFMSPKARVMQALSRTFGSGSIISEYSGNTRVSQYGYAPEYLADLLKATDMYADMQKRGYSFDSSYAVSDLDTLDVWNSYYSLLSFSNIGMKVSGDVDNINRVAYYDTTLQVNFIKISLGKYYINDNAISLAMPSYFDGHLTLPTDTFGTSYNDSVFPSILGPIPQELESSISFSAFDLVCAPAPDIDSFMSDEDNLSVLKDFYDNMEVDKTDETRSIMIGTKKQECDEYRITLAEEDILSLIEAYEDWYFSSNQEIIESRDAYYAFFSALDSSLTIFPSSYSDFLKETFDKYKELIAVDHEIYVYLDNKNRLAAASYDVELDLSSTLSDSMQEMIDEYSDTLDDLIGYTVYPYLYSSGTASMQNNASGTTTDLPESCTISAEIIFHGKDSLPDRYEGSFLIAFDNGYSYEANYTGENRSETKDTQHSVLNVALDLSNGDTSAHYDIAYEASYQIEDKNLVAELTVTDEKHIDLLRIVSDSTLSLEDDTIEFDLDELKLTVNTESGESGVTIDAEVSFSPLTDRVPLPEGKERNMLTMSRQDYDQFFDEITDGLWWW